MLASCRDNDVYRGGSDIGISNYSNSISISGRRKDSTNSSNSNSNNINRAIVEAIV